MADKIEVAQRVQRVADMLISGANKAAIKRDLSHVCPRQVEDYIKRARELVAEAMAQEREYWKALTVEQLCNAYQSAVDEGNLTAQISALRLRAELFGLLQAPTMTQPAVTIMMPTYTVEGIDQ